MGARNKRKPKKKQPVHRPHQAIRTRPSSTRASQPAVPAAPVTAPDRTGVVVDPLAQWSRNRHGATSGRGYHFQEAVGAWLVARMLTDAEYTKVVPEGSHEDMTCEGTITSGVQVKSRQEGREEYRAAEVAQHLHDLHTRRTEHPYDGPARLVLERDVKEQPLPAATTTVGELAEAHPLKAAVAKRLSKHQLAPDAVDDILVEVLGFDEARRLTAEIVCAKYGVETAIGELIALRFTQLVCDAADENAQVEYTDRRFVDRTQLELVAQRTIDETDPSSLTAAINAGVCSPLDLRTALDDSTYFQGVHAQPGHIAAGLPTPRPDLVGTVDTGMENTGSVLITGPSGVGKSTVMWMTADANQHFTWFQVHRLTVDDVRSLVTLAEARRPTPAAPIGFLVDNVGLTDASGWDHLVDRLSGKPNVILVGTARVEDTYTITTLTKSTIVEVALDENVAERIHAQLLQADLTTQAHWREAFNQADGLTLEYTYYLTQGERLSDVLSSQVARLVRDKADAEIDVLALTTTAHMYGVGVPVAAAREALGLGTGALKCAITRLNREHFLAEESGVLTGLHLLRSAALSHAVHATPPPTQASTVERLLAHLPEESLGRFLFGVLRGNDDIDSAVIDTIVRRVANSDDQSGLLAAVMHNLRNSDFVRHARRWREVVLDAGVAPAHWPITIDLGLIESELIEGMDPAIAEAVEQLRADTQELTPLQDAFVDCLTPERIAEVVLAQSLPGRLAALLTSCGSGPQVLLDELDRANWAGTPAGNLLACCSAEEFANLAGVGRLLGPNIHQHMMDAAGGERAVLDRVLAAVPQMYSAHRRTGTEGEGVVEARLVFVDDELTPDIDETAKDVARLLLRSLPDCASADVKTLRAGDREYKIGDLTFGSSGLLVKYALTKLEVEWNRARSVLVLHELGFLPPGEHAARVATLLPQAVEYLRVLVTFWLTGKQRVDGHDHDWASEELRRLRSEVDQLTAPRTGIQPVDDSVSAISERIQAAMDNFRDGAVVDEHLAEASEAAQPEPDDSSAWQHSMPESKLDKAHTVLFSVFNHTTNLLLRTELRQLSFHARQVAKTLREVEVQEQWELGGLPGPPDALQTLLAQYYDIADICAALSWQAISVRDVKREARSGPVASAIASAARACRTAAKRATTQLLENLGAALAAGGVTAEIRHRDTDPDEGYWPPTDIAVLVECENTVEWAERSPTTVDAVLASRDGTHMESTLICPVIAGKREPLLAMKVHSSAYYLNDRYYDWFPDEPVRAPDADDLLADIDGAVGALVRRSGLNFLAIRRELSPELQKAYEQTEETVSGACERIKGRGDDACITEIVGVIGNMVTLVADERAGTDTLGQFAAEFYDSLDSKQSVMTEMATGLRLAAIEWMHEPQRAVELFT
jgi:hypothetical protein